MRNIWIATLAVAVLFSSQASAINTRRDWDGSTNIAWYSCPGQGTPDYGQVITIPKFRDSIGSFSFYLSGPNVGGQMSVRAEVYQWDSVNLRPMGSAVYESGPRKIAYKDTNYHRATFTANVSVTPGEQYILFLTTDKDADSCTNGYGLYWAGVSTGTYPGGRFYYLQNNSGDTSLWTTTSWVSYFLDTAFIATMPSN